MSTIEQQADRTITRADRLCAIIAATCLMVVIAPIVVALLV